MINLLAVARPHDLAYFGERLLMILAAAIIWTLVRKFIRRR